MSIYERPDSKYWWMWIEGTDIRQSTKVVIGAGARRRDSRAEAEEIYRAVMGDLARGTFKLPTDRPQISFAEFAAWYRDTIAAKHRGGRRATSICNALIRDLGQVWLQDLDTQRLEEWKAQRATVVIPNTVNRELDVLKPMLAKAVPKYLERSPAVDVKRQVFKDDDEPLMALADEWKAAMAGKGWS